MKEFFNKLKKEKDEDEQKRLKRNLTANQFVNVKDIKDKIVYSKDGYVYAYIKINPMSLELLNSREQKIIGREFTTQFSNSETEYKFISLSRPVDVSFMIDNYTNKLEETSNMIRKELLRNKIKEVNSFAFSGDILEHQFFLHLWQIEDKRDSEKELLKQANEFVGRFKSCKVEAKIATKNDIVKLYNLFSNPNYSHLEDDDTEDYVPFITKED